jgi:hypothetical protein
VGVVDRLGDKRHCEVCANSISARQMALLARLSLRQFTLTLLGWGEKLRLYRLKEFENDLQFLEKILKNVVTKPGARIRLIKHIRNTDITNLPFGNLCSTESSLTLSSLPASRDY